MGFIEEELRKDLDNKVAELYESKTLAEALNKAKELDTYVHSIDSLYPDIAEYYRKRGKEFREHLNNIIDSNSQINGKGRILLPPMDKDK